MTKTSRSGPSCGPDSSGPTVPPQIVTLPTLRVPGAARREANRALATNGAALPRMHCCEVASVDVACMYSHTDWMGSQRDVVPVYGPKPQDLAVALGVGALPQKIPSCCRLMCSGLSDLEFRVHMSIWNHARARANRRTAVSRRRAMHI